MSSYSKIEWTEATWNPVTGCTKISQGCKNCYAKRDWQRLSASPQTVYYNPCFHRCANPPRLDAALFVECQLTAQEKVLGAQGPARAPRQDHEPQSVREQQDSNLDERDHALIMPWLGYLGVVSSGHVISRFAGLSPDLGPAHQDFVH